MRERLVGPVPEQALEDRFEDETGEDDEGQPDERRERDRVAAEPPPDDRTAGRRPGERDPLGADAATSDNAVLLRGLAGRALEVGPVLADGALGLADLVVRHRPFLEWVVARRSVTRPSSRRCGSSTSQ